MKLESGLEGKFRQYFDLKILEVSDIESGGAIGADDRGIYAWYYMPPADWPSKHLIFRGSSVLREIEGRDIRSKEPVDIEWRSGVVESDVFNLGSIETKFFKYSAIFCSMPIYIGKSSELKVRLKRHVSNLRKVCDGVDVLLDAEDEAVKVFTWWLREYINDGPEEMNVLHPENFVVVAFVAEELVTNDHIDIVEAQLIKMSRPFANRK